MAVRPHSGLQKQVDLKAQGFGGNALPRDRLPTMIALPHSELIYLRRDRLWPYTILRVVAPTYDAVCRPACVRDGRCACERVCKVTLCARGGARMPAHQVLSLYRDCLRVARTKSPAMQTDIRRIAGQEFREHKTLAKSDIE
jgi:hypothetical protein